VTKSGIDAARKAAKLKAKRRKSAGSATDSARPPPGVRLLDRTEILQITGKAFPTIWEWMRAGKFPRSRMTGGSKSKSVWLSNEIDAWIAGLKVRPLKGDAPPDQKIKEPEPA
jgi:predicted DNA-binding transcriptional regulator AlpA